MKGLIVDNVNKIPEINGFTDLRSRCDLRGPGVEVGVSSIWELWNEKRNASESRVVAGVAVTLLI